MSGATYAKEYSEIRQIMNLNPRPRVLVRRHLSEKVALSWKEMERTSDMTHRRRSTTEHHLKRVREHELIDAGLHSTAQTFRDRRLKGREQCEIRWQLHMHMQLERSRVHLLLNEVHNAATELQSSSANAARETSARAQSDSGDGDIQEDDVLQIHRVDHVCFDISRPFFEHTDTTSHNVLIRVCAII